MRKTTVKDYAVHRGITERAVRGYLNDGTIPDTAIVRERHRVYIDQDAADKQLQKNITTRKQLLKPKAATSGLSFHEARTVKERFLAALRKLEYEEKSGKLVDAESVKIAAFNKARALRDTLLNIPDRIAPILAAEANETKINEILTKEIRSALESLSK